VSLSQALATRRISVPEPWCADFAGMIASCQESRSGSLDCCEAMLSNIRFTQMVVLKDRSGRNGRLYEDIP
jgi:hypothetical protein